MAGGGIGELLTVASVATLANEGLRAVGAPPVLRIPAAIAAAYFAPQGLATLTGAGQAAGTTAPFSALQLGDITSVPIPPITKESVLTPPAAQGGDTMNKAFQGLMIGSLAKGLLFPAGQQALRAPDVGSAPGRPGGFRPTADPQLQALMQQIALNRQRRFFGPA